MDFTNDNINYISAFNKISSGNQEIQDFFASSKFIFDKLNNH